MPNKRYNSSIINLRIYHNWIKNNLYHTAAKNLRTNYNQNDINILELAVGKGGDLYKWIGINAKEVIGVDIDKESIYGKNGAIHRYKRKLKNIKEGESVPKCFFYVDDLLSPSSFQNMKKKFGNKKFNIISCQFAVHYFFESNTALKNICNILSHFLEPEGYFIGTTMDPDEINKLFMETDKVEKNLFTIESKTDIHQSYTPYGNKYEVSLGKKDEDHYFGQKASIEYLFDKSEIETLLKEKNINLVEYTNFSNLYEKYVEENPTSEMTNDEAEFSFLNTTFIFQKQGD